MTLRQAERWLKVAESQSVLLWQSSSTVVWRRWTSLRWSFTCNVCDFFHSISDKEFSVYVSCWPVISWHLVDTAGEKQLSLCENPIEREISILFTKLNKLFFFFPSQISPASGLVSILKKRGASVDDTVASASSELQADRTPAKRRVRFRVPDDGYEHG